MRNDLCDITVLLDRSFSMEIIKSAVEESYNKFIHDQKKDPGETRLTLIQFDDQYETPYIARGLNNVPQLLLEPRGNTALLAAMKRAIRETGERLASMREADRPGKVMFVIVTDGEENSSFKIEWEKIKSDEEVWASVDHQRKVYNWLFIFMGSNQDAIRNGAKLGVARGSSLTFANNKAGVKRSFEYLTSGLSNYKSMDAAVYNCSVQVGELFTEEQRKEQELLGTSK